MSSPLNSEIVHSGATNTVFPLNRWGTPKYAVQLISGTWSVEGTLAQVNRGDTPTWAAIDDSAGVAITTIAGTGQVINVDEVALEAMRVVSTGAGTIRIMQQGFTDRI